MDVLNLHPPSYVTVILLPTLSISLTMVLSSFWNFLMSFTSSKRARNLLMSGKSPRGKP